MKNNIVCSERAPLKAGAGRGEGEKLLSYSRSGGEVDVFVAAASRHENFQEDKINLREPIFDEASSLFLMEKKTMAAALHGSHFKSAKREKLL